MALDMERISGEQFRNVIQIMNPCMDDYLYILDLKEDIYCISESATERFDIPESKFGQAAEIMKGFVYPADYWTLQEDIALIQQKKKDFHNLQYRWLDKEGKPIWINCRGRVLFDDEGNPEFLIGCINEIGKKQKADNVSGLLGAFNLQSLVGEFAGQRLTGYILRIGIDNFKEINENKGMNYGDMILRKTADCIRAVVTDRQKLYRIVSDEFLVVDFEGTPEEAEAIYHEIRKEIDAFIVNNRYEVFYTVSAGILDLADVTKHDFENLMKLAEFALNEAKARGKNRCYRYEKDEYHRFLRKRELIQIMRQSVNHGFKGFETYYQPIVDIRSNKLSSAETLLRFKSEETGFVSPMEFIPLLEESGLIIPVGKWVLDQAMEACSKIQKYIPDFRVSVNLSYIQVLKSNVLTEILDSLSKNGLKMGSVLVELTESGFLESDENFLSFCNGLKEYGIPLALDDFGTGYSNFHYLYNLSPNTIKIDRSFTLKALKNDYEYNLLKHMVDMAHSINLNLCIEGIETKEELDKICEIDPDYIQGYYFGKPSPFDVFMKEFVENKQE